MKTLPLLTVLAISASVLTVSGCMREQMFWNSKPGEYKHSQSNTDSRGNVIEHKRSTKVSVDKNGHKKAVVTTKNTKDPKGLMNKTTTSETKEIIEEK